MMTQAIQIEEDGFLPVTIAGVEVMIDLYTTHNRLIELRRQAETDETQTENHLVKEYVQSLGYPTISERTAVKFANAIFKAVDNIQKKDESAQSPSTSAD